MGGGKGGGGHQVVGWKFYLGMHMGICAGPIDEFRRMKMGGKNLWVGTKTSNSQLNIEKAEIFGGEKKEGGFEGKVDIMFGESNQTKNSYLNAHISGTVPAYRGIAGVVLRQPYVAANNPYLKNFEFDVTRYYTDWYSAKAKIGEHMNPAHIIYECLVNNDFGMGWDTSKIDDTNFRAAADKLYEEGFGLSFTWSAQDKLGNFMQMVMDHIAASLYVHPSTGLFTLKLIRDDYDIETVPAFDESNVIELRSFERAAWSEVVNEVVVKYTDFSNGIKPDSVTWHNSANADSQGSLVSQTKDMVGLPSTNLAKLVAERVGRSLSVPLAKIELVVNRENFNLLFGDVFKFSWAKYGLVDVAFRIGSIHYGPNGASQIVVTAVEDVFGLPASTYAGTQPIGWEDPNNEPEDITQYRLLEASYYDIVNRLSAADFDYLDADAAFVHALCTPPTSDAYAYQMTASATVNGSYENVAYGVFTPSGQLTADLAITTESFTIDNMDNVDVVEVGERCLINNEAMEITSIDTSTGIVGVKRGILDTVPAAHSEDDIVWFPERYAGIDRTERLYNETVYYQFLTETGLGYLAAGDATKYNIALTGQRFQAPWPPGAVKIEAMYYPSAIAEDAEPSLTFAGRDRTQQTIGYQDYKNANVGPEVGVTYTITWYTADDTQIKQVTGNTSRADTLTTAEEISGVGYKSSTIRVTCKAVRDGIDSWTEYDWTFDRPLSDTINLTDDPGSADLDLT